MNTEGGAGRYSAARVLRLTRTSLDRVENVGAVFEVHPRRGPLESGRSCEVAGASVARGRPWKCAIVARMRFIAGRPVGIALAIVSLSVAACGGSDEGTDSAVLRDLASNDHAVSACLPSTPPTSLFEVFCQVGASGYCFNESLNPFF